MTATRPNIAETQWNFIAHSNIVYDDVMWWEKDVFWLFFTKSQLYYCTVGMWLSISSLYHALRMIEIKIISLFNSNITHLQMNRSFKQLTNRQSWDLQFWLMQMLCMRDFCQESCEKSWCFSWSAISLLFYASFLLMLIEAL